MEWSEIQQQTTIFWSVSLHSFVRCYKDSRGWDPPEPTHNWLCHSFPLFFREKPQDPISNLESWRGWSRMDRWWPFFLDNQSPQCKQGERGPLSLVVVPWHGVTYLCFSSHSNVPFRSCTYFSRPPIDLRLQMLQTENIYETNYRHVKKVWSIGCVILRCNLQCGITQPILRFFWHLCTDRCECFILSV